MIVRVNHLLKIYTHTKWNFVELNNYVVLKNGTKNLLQETEGDYEVCSSEIEKPIS